MKNASNHHEVFDIYEYDFEEDSPSGYAQIQLMSCWNATPALPIVLTRLKQSGEREAHPVLSAVTASAAQIINHCLHMEALQSYVGPS